MKDIVIPAKRMKSELKILLACWIVANLVNVFAILKYDTNWIEIITFQPMVLLITLALYLLTWVTRLLLKLSVLLARRNAQKQ